jgi:CheY-like chemotaxis protein
MLRMAGYQVLEASAGRQALTIAAGRPDLVLLDVYLPDLDGYEVCRRLRAEEETRDLLIAHLSAVSVKREDRIRGLDHGADAYWTTPMEEEELLARIFDRFERATSARQSESLGLGLFIAREIVTAHGGSITVRSRPGGGSAFQARLSTGVPGSISSPRVACSRAPPMPCWAPLARERPCWPTRSPSTTSREAAGPPG